MAIRIRKDKLILCAAKSEALVGDTYIDDNLHYVLSNELKVLSVVDHVGLTEVWEFHKASDERFPEPSPPIKIEMDEECIKLCEAMNSIVGIKTYESCCGHNAIPYSIFFESNSDGLQCFFSLIPSHIFSEWIINVNWNSTFDKVTYNLEGPIGKDSYDQSERIAECIIGMTKQPTSIPKLS